MYKEKIIDIKTGKETFRDYTEKEIEEVEKSIAELAERDRQFAILENRRQSALSKLIDLGLTEEEIAAL